MELNTLGNSDCHGRRDTRTLKTSVVHCPSDVPVKRVRCKVRVEPARESGLVNHREFAYGTEVPLVTGPVGRIEIKGDVAN